MANPEYDYLVIYKAQVNKTSIPSRQGREDRLLPLDGGGWVGVI